MAIYDFFGNEMPISWSPTVVRRSDSLIDNVSLGTAGNDMFLVGLGPYLLIGGAGDDSYYQVTSDTRIGEGAGLGVDTVYVASSYTLPDFVENLVIGYAKAGVIGNGLGNYMVGNVSAQSFDGAGGNDVFTGNGGGDSYVCSAGSGYDLITDFRAGSAAGGVVDTVRLAGYAQFKTFADVRAALSQVGGDVVLRLDGGDAVKFAGTQLSAFTADNFQLHFDPSGLKLAFSDDFDAGLDWSSGSHSSRWRTDYGFGAEGSLDSRTFVGAGYQQVMVDATMKGFGDYSGVTIGIDPFSVAGGVLTIHAAPAPVELQAALAGYHYTSGVINTRNSFTATSGYFEARMKLPAGGGAWPAFWLYSVDGSKAELDVMESHNSSEWTGTSHDYWSGVDVAQCGQVYSPDLSTTFHDYGLLWTAETVTWYLDGVAVKTIATPPGTKGPMFVLVEMAVDRTVTPAFIGADLQIDRVRAYSLDGGDPGVTGGANIDTLTDAAGAVRLEGLMGNDIYYVSSSATKVVEAANGGYDEVRASVGSYVLPDNVELLTLIGPAIGGTGNALNTTITGNALDNVLAGGAGDDRIDGAQGADRMIGGVGGDVYFVDSIKDRVVEEVGEGFDQVYASADFRASANVEVLRLTGSAIRGWAGLTGTMVFGDDMDNILTGRAGSDQLSGGAGDDRLTGAAGYDILTGGAGADTFVLTPGMGTDSIKDFELGVDQIKWDALADAFPKGPTLTNDASGNGVATFGSDRVIFSGVTAAQLIAAGAFEQRDDAPTVHLGSFDLGATAAAPHVSHFDCLV